MKLKEAYVMSKFGQVGCYGEMAESGLLQRFAKPSRVYKAPPEVQILFSPPDNEV